MRRAAPDLVPGSSAAALDYGAHAPPAPADQDAGGVSEVLTRLAGGEPTVRVASFAEVPPLDSLMEKLQTTSMCRAEQGL